MCCFPSFSPHRGTMGGVGIMPLNSSKAGPAWAQAVTTGGKQPSEGGPVQCVQQDAHFDLLQVLYSFMPLTCLHATCYGIQRLLLECYWLCFSPLLILYLMLFGNWLQEGGEHVRLITLHVLLLILHSLAGGDAMMFLHSLEMFFCFVLFVLFFIFWNRLLLCTQTSLKVILPDLAPSAVIKVHTTCLCSFLLL